MISTPVLGKQAAETGLDYLRGKIQLAQQITDMDVANVLLFNWRLLKQLGDDPK